MSEYQTKTCIIIDSNAWNFLHVSGIELSSPALQGYEFAITLEILREMEALSSVQKSHDLYHFFTTQRELIGEERVFFGFFDSCFGEDEQRSGGFGYGGMASVHERNFIEKNAHMVKESKRGIYYGNEADLLIAARAGGRTFILTEDNSKPGPFKGLENIINVSRSMPMSVDDFKELLDSST